MTYTHYIAHSISKIQTARPAGKCLCGENNRLTASAADTAQSAAPRSRNERSLHAVVGGEIDFGYVYTEEEGL